MKIRELFCWIILIPVLGGRGRRISEFQANLVYKQDSQGYTDKPCFKQNKTKQNKTLSKKQTKKKPYFV